MYQDQVPRPLPRSYTVSSNFPANAPISGFSPTSPQDRPSLHSCRRGNENLKVTKSLFSTALEKVGGGPFQSRLIMNLASNHPGAIWRAVVAT